MSQLVTSKLIMDQLPQTVLNNKHPITLNHNYPHQIHIKHIELYHIQLTENYQMTLVSNLRISKTNPHLTLISVHPLQGPPNYNLNNLISQILQLSVDHRNLKDKLVSETKRTSTKL